MQIPGVVTPRTRPRKPRGHHGRHRVAAEAGTAAKKCGARRRSRGAARCDLVEAECGARAMAARRRCEEEEEEEKEEKASRAAACRVREALLRGMVAPWRAAVRPYRGFVVWGGGRLSAAVGCLGMIWLGCWSGSGTTECAHGNRRVFWFSGIPPWDIPVL